MKSLCAKIVVVLLTAGLLSACGAQSVDTPTSAPKATSVPATQAPTATLAATDTAAPTGHNRHGASRRNTASSPGCDGQLCQ
jgi:uncharacterized lipoprotein YbaY